MTRHALDKLMMDVPDNPVAREHVTGYFKLHPEFVKIVRAAPYPALARKGGPRLLKLRDELRRDGFSWLLALRLIPITAITFGRAGLLAHPCMLHGDRGGHCASLGCVSFRKYTEFLRAYLNGQVRRLEVIAGG